MSKGIDTKPIISSKLIDVDKVIKQKIPKFYKFIPPFIISYIKKILHQEELNRILYKNRNYNGLEFVNVMSKNFKLKFDIFGYDNIPPNNKYIFAANHPIGALESYGFIKTVGDKYPKLRILVNDVLLTIKNFEPLFVPINKYGGQAKESVKLIEDAYKSENQILIYPAGIVSRKINGKIQDFEWHQSFIKKAILHKRDIIPVYIDAKNSKFFYRLSSFRRKIGIKANIETFYLANEGFKQINTTIGYYYGKPIPYSTFNKTKKPKEWAAKVRAHVYELKENINKEFNSK